MSEDFSEHFNVSIASNWASNSREIFCRTLNLIHAYKKAYRRKRPFPSSLNGRTTSKMTTLDRRESDPTQKVCWRNIVVFVSIHISAFLGVYWMPPTRVARATLCMSFILWQLANFGYAHGE